MNNSKVEMLFKMIKMDLVLSIDNLIRYGFSQEDIDWLVVNSIIELRENDIYEVIDTYRLRCYGIKLIVANQLREANICFKKCFEIKPYNRNICLQYLLSCIKLGNYCEALKVYDQLITICPDRYSCDNNLYLYLISTITELDEKHAKEVKSLSNKKIMLPSCSENKLDNTIRKCILNSKFTYAYKLVNDRRFEIKYYLVQYELLKTLLDKSIDSEKMFKANLFNLTKEENYDEILLILRRREKQRKLSKLETYILLITDAIVDILSNNNVRKATINDTDDLLQALRGNNFKLALKINNSFLKMNDQNPDNDTVNILLIKLNNLMNNPRVDNMFYNNLDYVEENLEDIITYNKDIEDAEELAYYIKDIKTDLKIYAKRVGLLKKYVLLVNLVYARDYYFEGNYAMGDKLIQEIERSLIDDKIVLKFLKEVKLNRDTYKDLKKSYHRKLVQQ